MSAELHDILLLRGYFDPERLQQSGSNVTPAMMTTANHRTMAELLSALYYAGEEISPATVRTRLELSGDTPDAAKARIADILAEECPSEKHLATLLKSSALLSEKSERQKLGDWLRSESGIRATPEQVNDRLSAHASILGGIAGPSSETFLEGLRRITADTSKPRVYTLDFGRLDERYKIYAHSFNVVMADSGGGKTSFLLNGAFNLAKKGVNSYVISIEMDMDSVHARLAGMACGIPVWKFDERQLSQEDRDRVQRTIEKNPGVFDRIIVETPSSLSAELVPGMASRLKSRHGDGIMWIDYLQSITTSGRHINDTTSMQGQVSSVLTRAAKSTGMPIIALSQITAGATGMDRIKGSKQAKHDGWTILELRWRDDKEPADDCEEAFLNACLVKGRKKGTFKSGIPLLYNLSTQRMYYTDQFAPAF